MMTLDLNADLSVDLYGKIGDKLKTELECI